jgi:hypothetical protein
VPSNHPRQQDDPDEESLRAQCLPCHDVSPSLPRTEKRAPLLEQVTNACQQTLALKKGQIFVVGKITRSARARVV